MDAPATEYAIETIVEPTVQNTPAPVESVEEATRAADAAARTPLPDDSFALLSAGTDAVCADGAGDREKERVDDVDVGYELMVRDLDEVLGSPAEIRAIMRERKLVAYWGTAPTGKPHLAYFVPVFKIADLLAAGCRVKILFANMHAYLDNQKTSWELIESRCQWYELVIKSMLRHIGVSIERLEFVRGTDYQRGPNYSMDLLRLTGIVTSNAAQKAASQVVKMSDDPLLSALLYPLMQALDEHYLDCDIELGGVDQRKIFALARDYMPRLGYRKRHYLLNRLVPGLAQGGKMSASEPHSKIDLCDTDAAIRAKIRKAYSEECKVEGNGLLAILKHILWRWLEPAGLPFVAPRRAQYGGPLSFRTHAQVEAAFALPIDHPDRLYSCDLKAGVADLLCEFLHPLRTALAEHADLADAAYP